MFPSPLSLLWDGSKLALRHPWISLAICILGTGLSGLAPLLMVRGGLGDNPAIENLLLFVALLPLDMYFLPRLVLRLDAETLGHPKNPVDGWKEAFEARWLRAFGAKVLLGVAAGLGILMFILPGLAVLFCFGWAPMRVLLRGEKHPGSLHRQPGSHAPPVAARSVQNTAGAIGEHSAFGFRAIRH